MKSRMTDAYFYCLFRDEHRAHEEEYTIINVPIFQHHHHPKYAYSCFSSIFYAHAKCGNKVGICVLFYCTISRFTQEPKYAGNLLYSAIKINR